MPGLAARAEPRRRVLWGRLWGGRRLAHLTVVTVAVCLLTGCGWSPPASPPSAEPNASSGGSDATPATQSALDALGAAILRQDRPAFYARIATRDPAFAAVADRIFTNLSAMRLQTLSFRLGARHQEPEPTRRALLGGDAVAREVAVSWRLRADSGSAQHQIWMTFLPGDGGVTVAGTTDGPDERSAQPYWLVEPLRVATSAHATTLTASAGASRWLQRGGAAACAVRKRLTGGLGAAWNGELVLEVPSTRQAFERVLGVAPGSYASIAAVAWPEGPDASTAALRIVVNPGVTATLGEQGLAVLLTHEAVHVATRSAASQAPTWLVEGLADYVAYDAYPATATVAAAALLRRVRDRGAPTALPTDDQFAPSAQDLPLTYAEAWTACRLLAEEHSPTRLMRFYRAVSDGVDLRAALRRETGQTTAQLTAQWRRSLESDAA